MFGDECKDRLKFRRCGQKILSDSVLNGKQ